MLQIEIFLCYLYPETLTCLNPKLNQKSLVLCISLIFSVPSSSRLPKPSLRSRTRDSPQTFGSVLRLTAQITHQPCLVTAFWHIMLIAQYSLDTQYTWHPAPSRGFGAELFWHFCLKFLPPPLHTQGTPCWGVNPTSWRSTADQEAAALTKAATASAPRSTILSPFQANISFPIYDGPKVEDSCSAASTALLKFYALELLSSLMFSFYIMK